VAPITSAETRPFLKISRPLACVPLVALLVLAAGPADAGRLRGAPFVRVLGGVTVAEIRSFLPCVFDGLTTGAAGAPPITLTMARVLPVGVAFTDNGNGSGTRAGTPAQGTMGAYAVTFVASNGTTPATQTFTLTVAPAKEIPPGR
jgi:hypothetical protein